MTNRPSVWIFDVDGTLIGSIRSTQLRPGARELLETLTEAGTTLVLWSAGGAEYAHRMLAQFDLVHFFSGIYAKEERCERGLYRIDHIDPAHRPDTFVDDYPHEVPDTGRTIAVPQFLGGNPHDHGLKTALEIARKQP